MNNPAPQQAPHQAPHQALQTAPNIPTAILPNNAPDDLNSVISWGSESEHSVKGDSEDVDEDEEILLADEEYWGEERTADSWLAKYPGGSRVLYPRLFIVKPRGGKVVTPSRDLNTTCFLYCLPPELRNLVYKYYFARNEEVKRPEEEHRPFLDRNDKAIERINLGSEDVELQFWLTRALLQASRQLRFEAMPVLFENRVITVEWLPVLPRFVEFLGKQGCAMVRYLDIFDSFNLQGEESDRYREFIMSISYFPRLQHLRIVLDWGNHHFASWSDRMESIFDDSNWTRTEDLKEQAIPRMRFEDIEMHWPEYEILKTLKAQKFTLAINCIDQYLEFDRSYGALPEISKYIQSLTVPKKSAPSSMSITASSTSSEADAAIETIDIQHRGSVSTPSSEEGENPDSLTWQDTDMLPSKTIPFYNFVREFFYINMHYPLEVSGRLGVVLAPNFFAFPTARKSSGSIMRDCVFCYLNERHCGYHAEPDQPPFELKSPEGDNTEANVTNLKKRFENMSYVDMREACRQVAHHIELTNVTDFRRVFTLLDHVGWVEIPMSQILARLDAAVEVGWTGKRLDKQEISPWDMLYCEFRARFDIHMLVR